MTEAHDLACRQLVELVTDYFDDALPPDLRARFEAHLQACDGCVELVNQLRRTVETVGRLRAADLDPGRQAAAHIVPPVHGRLDVTPR